MKTFDNFPSVILCFHGVTNLALTVLCRVCTTTCLRVKDFWNDNLCRQLNFD